MKFGWTILYVENVANTVAFYERCFGLTRHSESPDGQFAEMDTGTTRLAFTQADLATSLIGEYRASRLTESPLGMEIAFIAEDVSAAYATAVQNGATSIHAPQTKPWGQIVAYVRDLNGILIEIASEMD